jgi:hypothetical protein
MPEFKPQPPISSDSCSVTLEHSPQPAQSGIPSYGSMSYTVVNAAPAVIGRDHDKRETRPLSASAIRVVNSILHAKVNKAAIRRDKGEDI